ncbi:fumarylacetoacetate hydrolase family protein [Streptomyces stelliscabiei]|uniref:fumarylacetoacetate hydrolase family protein n=1 Tax=Streptomyces stelliscabiei TaxID=146820 RepID=UPI0029BA831B|nr:fumarylacetoacetate hydrolase family protein [Streptomyces stelliscabiei]MDX2550718.1 fumarylacetoacetate hydrolase family protein [Streptomyces stelliscabiei]MDX2616899.1 fumarylacetoacetate hydrolase family protein [Streptomyces stelliscabiei]MDX2635895.1 fumarylacetoacetate hydrolase family protein [Streptomyces stelliscabiei]MDX2665647.1 fumarylacetoacetate hydrolase family protein [Streptomyces stelliscabiei]MDX2718202.1 fumarylacetoacetate hydrolase family protein [Streptomyces stelli
MRLATVSHAAGTSVAVLHGDTWRALPAADLSALLTATPPQRVADLAGEALVDAVPVLPLPAPAKVVCCGLNYADHIRETGRELPAYPTLFPKYADTLTGPEAEIVLPRGLQVDWEAELAVVVGATLRRTDRETALAGIAGYTVANDMSVRDWQYRTLEWFQGKAWDASTPLGPVIVTADDIDPTAGLDVICRVNGEQVQRDNTKTLVFDAADLLAYISTFTVLRPGDLVLTGTPGGVGVARTPQRFLSDGDVVETEIAGIGTLRNTVRLTD